MSEESPIINIKDLTSDPSPATERYIVAADKTTGLGYKQAFNQAYKTLIDQSSLVEPVAGSTVLASKTAGIYYRKNGGSEIKLLTAADLVGLTPLGALKTNALINPEFAINQRKSGLSYTSATPFANNDDSYLIDRWNHLSDGSNITDVERSSDAPTGSSFSMKFTVTTANKKFGPCQIIESKNSIPFDGKPVSLSFAAKTTTAKVINNIRVAILSWDSAADVVTSDVVSAWGASGVNPTFATNWTAENTASDLALTTSWQTFTIENISIDTSGMKNLVVFVWIDDTDAAVGDELFLSQFQMNIGATALDYQQRFSEQEIALCQRYFCKSYDIDVAPGTGAAGGLCAWYGTSMTSAAHSFAISVKHKVSMRVAPTVYTWTTDGANGGPSGSSVTMQSGFKTPTLTNVGTDGLRVEATDGAANSTRRLEFQYIADSEL